MRIGAGRTGVLGLIAVAALALAACSDDGGGEAASDSAPADSSPIETTAPVTEPPTTTTVAGVEAFAWEQVADGAPWGGRAGLRVVEQDGTLVLMGGRTPKQSAIPGDSTLWGDVWRSDDGGATWTEVASTGEAFPARAYFQAVEDEGTIYVIGGQDFAFPSSTFFNDVWRSTDGETWEQVTAAAPWTGRAGLMAAAFDGSLYVFGGSRNDDSAVVGPTGPAREYFNDVWRSDDGGATWEQVTATAPWSARAGGAVTVHDGALYLLGGEYGFLCSPQPDCTPPYLNDVWKTTDGETWEQVTPAAGWSPRPGHQCESLEGQIVCFGGFGQPDNPIDMWTSPDGATWTKLAVTPWNATDPTQGRYDFDSTVVTGPNGRAAIVTVGGDRETFDFTDPDNYLRIDDDVWRFAAP